MFPGDLEETDPSDPRCRSERGFVGRMNMTKLGFERAEPQRLGRHGYASHAIC